MLLADENQSRMSDVESFREIRERAAKYLSQNLDSSNLTVANSSGDAVEMLSQLLLCSDQVELCRSFADITLLIWQLTNYTYYMFIKRDLFLF